MILYFKKISAKLLSYGLIKWRLSHKKKNSHRATVCLDTKFNVILLFRLPWKNEYVNRRLGKYWYSNRDINKEQKEEFSEHQLILLEEKKQEMASLCYSSL